MDTVKVCWSGGKDSTAATYLHIKEGHKVFAVCFIPLLTEDIPLIRKDHFEFIMSTSERFKSYGVDVRICHGITYYDHVHSVITRGKNKGKFRGIGLGFGFCLFRDYSKIRAGLDSVIVPHDYIDIGIAYDEINRQSQLDNYKRSILCEKKYTERAAFDLCYTHDLLSPLYFRSGRDGCAICPNTSHNELIGYINDYPAALSVLLDIETFCRTYRPELCPYRKHQWFTDHLRLPYQYPLW